MQDNWNTTQLSFLPTWLDGHQLASKQLGKPLVLEEFGKVHENLRLKTLNSRLID